MMVVAVAEAASTGPANPKASSQHDETLENPRRPPLLDNGAGPRKPKSREVPSRYLSPSPSTSRSSSSSRRCPSPQVSRTTSTASMLSPFPPSTSSVLKRSQSAERRRSGSARPSTPLPEPRVGNALEISSASKLLTSTRSLSVSFQGEAFSLPISKTKAAPSPISIRKGTPERRRVTPPRGKVDSGGGENPENLKPNDHRLENSKPNDHRWPGRSRQANPLSVSLDCTRDKKLIGLGVATQALKQSLIDEGRRASFDGRLSLDSGTAALRKGVLHAPDANSAPSDLTASDTESVSSGSTSGAQECNGVSRGRSTPRGIAGSARFWQETNSRLRRLQDPGSQLSSSPNSRTGVLRKLLPPKRFPGEDPLSSPRTMSSPVRGAARPASPSKLSPARGILSPSRIRNEVVSTLSSRYSFSAPSISFSLDLWRGKMGDNRYADAHLLRLLHNQYLQWRFVNARAKAAVFMQTRTTERTLWNASIAISDLRKSVRVKRIELQLLRQKLKLTSVLRGQLTYLEDWALLDREHSNSLMGAMEALKASTLRLPLVGGATAEIQCVKDAVGSAVNVMQAMTSSICFFLSKVEEVNSLLTELSDVAAKERAFLSRCRDFLSILAAIQIKDCSLKAHKLQLDRVPSA